MLSTNPECFACCMLSNRFVKVDDLQWFEKTVKRIVTEEVNEETANQMMENFYFTDFMRWAWVISLVYLLMCDKQTVQISGGISSTVWAWKPNTYQIFGSIKKSRNLFHISGRLGTAKLMFIWTNQHLVLSWCLYRLISTWC